MSDSASSFIPAPTLVDPRILAIIRDPGAPQARLPIRVRPPDSLPGKLGMLAGARLMLGFASEGVVFGERLHRRYGDIFRCSQGLDPLVAVWDLAEAQKILRNEHSAWSTAMGWDALLFGLLEPRGGNAGTLASLDFDAHRVARRLVQPAFNTNAIRGYVELAQPLIANAVAGWLRRREVGFKREARELLADVTNAIFTGIEPASERARIDRSLRATWSASLSLVHDARLSPGVRRGQQQWQFLCTYFSSLLAARHEAPGRDTFSQLVLSRERSPAGDAALVKMFVGIMLAAYDTTSAAVTSLAYLLAKHPAWQQRLREEAREVGPGPLDWSALQKLEQLEWAWKESLRLMPVAGYVPRVALREVELMGHRLPAGCRVAVITAGSGRSPKLWRDPERFDPERFSPARAEDKQHVGQYAPFGGGAHACIGQQLASIEARLLFHTLLTQCRFDLRRPYRARHIYAPLGTVSGAVELRLSPL